MNKKIKMLVVPSDKSGCGFYRSLAPHVYIAENYGEEFDIDIVYDFPTTISLEEFLKQYDLIHFHKQFDNELKIINLIKKLGIKTILDIDDHWDLGDYHPLSLTAKKENWKEPIIEHMKLVDYVSTTTEFFKKDILKYNKNVLIFPNAINPKEEQFIPKPTESERLRFGIICGSSHINDIKILDGMIKQLPKDIIDKVQFVLCGFDTRGNRTIYYNDTKETVTREIEPQESVWCEYEKIITNNYQIVKEEHKNFLLKYTKQMDYYDANDSYRRCWTKVIQEYATHYNNIDVLLVPLKETNFNKVKSQLKVIETGFFNKAIIAQNYGPYTIDLTSAIDKGGEVNPNGNALLVDSSKNHKQWAKYIKRLVEDRELLKQLQTNLHDTVKDKYSLDTICKYRVEEYKKIVQS